VIRLTRLYDFPAAHVLASGLLSDAENTRIFGKCANPNGHGHNYGVEVTVAGQVDHATGQLVAIDELDRIFEEAVDRPFSHRMLNELGAFAGQVPTAENIARVIHDALEPLVAERTRARLAQVRVVETASNAFEYGEVR
jgi:6-pyruvoyltetrahydropterin/6-carboxytetrahydropterin synthase